MYQPAPRALAGGFLGSASSRGAPAFSMAIARMAGRRHIVDMREPAFDYWRLLALVLFIVALLAFSWFWRWLVEEQFSGSAQIFAAGVAAGVFLSCLLMEWDARQRRRDP